MVVRGKTTGYDSDLQMFVEQPREPDLAQLRFLRWLSERDLLEHGSLGAPTGQYADTAPRSKAASASQ